MKVLLKQDIERVGRMGEVIEVASGYARNFLIPRGLAVGVTRGTVKDIADQKRVLDVKAARQREQLQGVAEKVATKPLVITARCSASGKLFGSITNRQLAATILEATGDDIDRHKIHVDDRIRSVGHYKAVIKLHPDVEIEAEFEVKGEGFEAEEPPDEEAAAAGEAVEPDLITAEAEPPVEEESGDDAGEISEPAEDEEPQPEQG
ncbi:MAG: 50S ribosomal protein L9 [Candidatus Geothermincolia bacterium]